MQDGSRIANERHGKPVIRRVWLWLGLVIGTTGGVLAGWLIAL
ncbi:hypothetical protein [Sandarakinorhabdus sp.]|jgi:hypothetical protein